MGRLRIIEDLGPLDGRRVLLRADLNVPLDGGRVSDDLRITAALPTIQELRDAGASIVLCSHLGRPKGRPVDELRPAPVAARLQEAGGFPVRTAEAVTGSEVTEAAEVLATGEVLLLENL